MDKHTHGNSKAAINLVGILEKPENIFYEHKASKILSKYFKTMKALACIPDKEIRETSYIMWRNHYLNWIDNAQLPELVLTHLKCVVVGHCRGMLKSIQGSN